MSEKKELKEEQTNKVEGGLSLYTIIYFKCRKCQHTWESNSVEYGKVCPKCESTDIEQL